MKRSHLQTAALLALGLVGAVTINLWSPGEEGQGAVPAPPSPTPSATPETSSTPEPTPDVSQPPASQPSATASPSASASAARSVRIPSRAPASANPSAPSQRATPGTSDDAGRAPSAVTGLRAVRNSVRSVVVAWSRVDGASQYAVYLNGSRIATVGETTATIIWESPSVSVGVAAVGPNGTGPMATIRVQRPAGAPTTAPARETRPVQPPARQDPPPTTTRPVEPVQPAPDPEPAPPAPPAPNPEPPLPDPEPAPREPQVDPVPIDEPTAPAGDIVPGPGTDPSDEP